MFTELEDARRLADMVNTEMPDFPHKPVILCEVWRPIGEFERVMPKG